MALLKFRCKNCGKVFDELVSFDKLDTVRCPECGSAVERAYEGKCASSKKESCSGNCSCCGGCH